MTCNYWASRTARGHNDYFWTELQAGRLRQGWGYDPEQNLHLVMTKSWKERSDVQRETERQRHMLGEGDGWQDGDVVLVPNLPERGMFALARITGPYRFEKSDDHDDFGHIREVELLTPHGVANTSPIVGSALRSTLRTSSRTWRVRGRDAEFERVLKHANDPEQVQHSTETQRTEAVLGQAMDAAVGALQRSFVEGLNDALGKAEWEKVIALALKSHFPTAEVEKRGGPSERGADVTVELPNPFGGAPWVIVIQVKDYQGEVGPQVVGQLREAIEAYGKRSEDGSIGKHVIAAVLASTNAPPSAALEAEVAKLERETGVPITVAHGEALMELILRGVVQHDAFQIG